MGLKWSLKAIVFNPTFNNLLVVLDFSRAFFGTCATIVICLKVGKWSASQLLPSNVVSKVKFHAEKVKSSLLTRSMINTATKIDKTVAPLFANAFKYLCLADIATISPGQILYGVIIGLNGRLVTRRTDRFVDGNLLTRLLWLENSRPWFALGSCIGSTIYDFTHNGNFTGFPEYLKRSYFQ